MKRAAGMLVFLLAVGLLHAEELKLNRVTGSQFKGWAPMTIRTCDWNRNGNKDLIVSSPYALYLYMNQKGKGSAGFGCAHPLFGRISYACPSLVDFDGDGREDIIVSKGGGAYLQVYRRKGEFDLEELRKIELPELPQGQERWEFSFGDLNNDGMPDLLYVLARKKEKESTLQWQRNKGGFDFCQPEELKIQFEDKKISFSLEGRTAFQIVDWDGDNKNDIICGSYGGPVYLYRNVGKDKPLFLPPVSLKDAKGEEISAGYAAYSAVCAVDWDDDGDMDLILGSRRRGLKILLLENKSSLPHTYAFGSPVELKATDFPCEFKMYGASGDMNNDGETDIVYFDGDVYWCKNLGGGRFEKEALIEGAAKEEKLGPPTVADFNKDGKPDIFLYTGKGAGKLYLNEGMKIFPLFLDPLNISVPDAPAGAQSAKFTAVDWDKDGWTDLIGGGYGNDIFLYRNKGGEKPSFLPGEKLDFGTDVKTCLYEIADWDGDGKEDILFLKSGKPSELFWCKRSDTGFSSPKKIGCLETGDDIIISMARGGNIGKLLFFTERAKVFACE